MTTTKGSVLDKHKLEYEDMPLGKVKLNKPKRPSIIKAYFNYLVEVILK